MNILPIHIDKKIAWLLLFLLFVPSFAFAGVPLEVGAELGRPLGSERRNHAPVKRGF